MERGHGVTIKGSVTVRKMQCDIDLWSTADNLDFKQDAKDLMKCVIVFYMTQKGRIQFEQAIERNSSFDCEESEKRGIYSKHFSLYWTVNAFCFLFVVQCLGRSMCVASLSVEAISSDEIIRTVSQMPTHTLIR